MANKSKATTGGRRSKRTPEEMAIAIQSKDAEVRAAIQGILQEAGLHGVDVHSVAFSVDPDAMTASGCFPPCDPLTEKCVSIGGSWVCVPI